MIKSMGTGLYADDDVQEGFVAIEEREPGKSAYLDLYCHPTTAMLLCTEGHVGRVRDLFADTEVCGSGYARSGEPTSWHSVVFAIPPQFLMRQLEDEMIDVVNALRLLEPEISSHCQYPPCVLRSERVAGGYSLCGYHGDRLVDRAIEAIAG